MIITGNFTASKLLSDDKQILTEFVVFFFLCDRKILGGNLYILEYLKILFSVAVST